jgi:Zn-dependent M16 (insulinase) family peptidase
VKNFDEKSEEIKATLRKVSTLLFTKDHLVASTTCGNQEKDPFLSQMAGFFNNLRMDRSSLRNWRFDTRKKNEGIATASQVQYVMEGYNFKKLGHSWNGKMRVLNQVLSTDWLQTQVRVIGGAYGGYCSVAPSGFFTFNSYRDPNLKETLENFAGTPGYLDNFEADEKTMTRYIIGTISSMDQPLTPSQKGDQAVSHYFTKRTLKDLQTDRDAVLSTTAQDIRNFSGMIRDILDQKNICILGNEEKINQEKDIFDHILVI